MSSNSLNQRAGAPLDLIFKILLLVFCIAMIALLLYTGFFSEDSSSEKFFTSLVSGGGLAASFYAYMKWRIIELVILKAQFDPETVDAEFVKGALKLIPRK